MVRAMKNIETRGSQSIVSPQFLLRVGGLPIDVVDQLRFDETREWIKQLLLLEQQLAERKDELVDTLHQAVNKYKEEKQLRQTLIEIKRDVFNLRMPSSLAKISELARALTSPERELLMEWVKLWSRYSYLLSRSQETFTQELYQKRAQFKQIIEIPDFRKGMLLSSQVLDRAIDSYLASDNQRLNRNARTVERSMFEYLQRAACKTSPFSTFTSVCHGHFDFASIRQDEDVVYHLDDVNKRSFIRLNMAILSKLSSFILSSDTLRKELLVQLTPGWHIQNNRIRYLRRVQAADDRNSETPKILEVIHENVFYLPVGHLLGTLLELMGDGRRARYEEIVSRLCNKPEYTGMEEKIDFYLQHLLRLGLLIIPDLQMDIHSQNPVSSYRQGLMTLGIPTTDRIASYLQNVEALVDVYGTASHMVRREKVKLISEQIKHCYSLLGQEQATLPQTIVYEDTTLNPQHLTISKTAWHEIFADVAEFQRLLPVFDMNLPRRLVTKGYFQSRYGKGQRCDDFLSFAYEFRQGFFEQYMQRDGILPEASDDADPFPRRMNHFKQPEIEQLNNARLAVANYVREAYQRLPAGSQALRLADDFATTISRYVPRNTGRISSHALFTQFARVDAEPLLIVNHIYSGLTLMFSRFAHFFSEEEGHHLVTGLRTTLERLQPPGTIFAELKGGYDTTNLNLHPQVTKYELVCPGDKSLRPRDEQIPLEDLYIQDNEQEGTLCLYSKRLGKEVIPLYLGFLLPMALPEIQQVLLNFSYATMCPLDLWKGTGIACAEDALAYHPRVIYKHLVLQRARWTIQPSAFPQRASGQSDADFFLSVARWQRMHNLPSRVFVTFETPRQSSSPQAAETETDQHTRSYKPLYVDFENYFSVVLLEASLRGFTHRVHITEMLPDHDHLWLKHNGQSYVSEFVWEMNTLKEENDD